MNGGWSYAHAAKQVRLAERSAQKPHSLFLHPAESSIIAMLLKQQTAILDSQIQ
jgi:hypothetical protein